MSFRPIRTALKYVSAWGMVAGFVAILSIIFSFLGALFCASLAGMMMGATHASRKLSVPFSLMCPGILLAVLRTQRSELAQRQVWILLLLCLAAFWVLYLVSAALMAQEQKAASTNGKLTPVLKGELLQAAHRVGESADGPCAGVVPPACIQAEALEGNWCCEVSDQDGRRQKRTLEIKHGALVLRTLDAEGRVCACAQGRLQWLDLPASPALAVSPAADEAEFPSPAI